MSTESTEQGHRCLGRQGGAEGAGACGHGELPRTQAQTRARHTAHTAPMGAPASPALGQAQVLGWIQGPGWVQQGLYQGLIGREHGGISAVPVQGHQRHRPKFLLGEVGGGVSAQDHGAQVIVLCTGTGWGQGSRPASPSPAHLGGTTSLHSPEP